MRDCQNSLSGARWANQYFSEKRFRALLRSIRSNEYKKPVIQARSNVGVLNMPSPETEHWVESIPMHADVRIALSDWLL